MSEAAIRSACCHSSSESDIAERRRTEHHNVKHKAGTQIPTEIVYEESPVGDSNANGSIERANQTIQGQIRAIKDYTERQTGASIGRDTLSFDMACTSYSMDIDDVPHWQRR